MSDPRDPFAAQPYVPPTQQGASTPEQQAPPAEPTTPPDDREQTVILPAEPQAESTGDEPPNRGRRRLAGALAVVVLAAAAGIGGAAGYDALTGDDDVVSSLDADSNTEAAPVGNIEKVAQKVLPSVVQIQVATDRGAAGGSGIVISSDGQVLTNNHVVESATDGGAISVAFADGTRAEAEVLGTDSLTDLAVVKAKGKTGLTPAELGSSKELRVGQEVVAIGSPFGLENTVTSGIIGAVNRPISLANGANDQATIFPAIQTDASINSGNSGGALVDSEGRVIGVTTLIQTPNAGSVGLGFAIPIDLAKNIARQLADGKEAEHARIGVTVGAAIADDSTRIGAEVKEVTKGSAGDKAGLEKGDVVTSINDRLVDGPDAMVAAIRGYQPGEKVSLTFQRDGEKRTVDVTLESDGGTAS